MYFSIYHNLCISSKKLNFHFLLDSLTNALENGENDKDELFIESIIKGLEIHLRENNEELLFSEFLKIFLDIIKNIEQNKGVNFCLINIFQTLSLILGFSLNENEFSGIYQRIEGQLISLLRAKLFANEFPL